MPYALQQMVIDFHKAMNLSIGDPRDPDITTDQDLRVSLIKEEMQELEDALFAGDTVEVADALGDILYTVAGAAVSWGIDLGPIFEEIHFSNMTKEPAGQEAKKITKGDKYKPPQIATVLKQSAQEFGHAFRDGDDAGWPLPKLPQVEPSSEVSKKIMTAAVMKTIKADFVPDTKSNGLTEAGDLYTFHPEFVTQILEQSQQIVDDLFDHEEPTNPVAKMRVGHMTNYGAYVFCCVDCDRTHAASNRLGSRGGVATATKVECICGKAYVVNFSATGEEPTVEVTTIEDLRKDQA